MFHGPHFKPVRRQSHVTATRSKAPPLTLSSQSVFVGLEKMPERCRNTADMRHRLVLPLVQVTKALLWDTRGLQWFTTFHTPKRLWGYLTRICRTRLIIQDGSLILLILHDSCDFLNFRSEFWEVIDFVPESPEYCDSDTEYHDESPEFAIMAEEAPEFWSNESTYGSDLTYDSR